MKDRPGVTHFWYSTSPTKMLVDLRSKGDQRGNNSRSHFRGRRRGEAGIGRKAFYFLPFEPEKVNHDGNRQTYLYTQFWGRRSSIIRQQRQHDALRCWESHSKSKGGGEGRAYLWARSREQATAIQLLPHRGLHHIAEITTEPTAEKNRKGEGVISL